MSYTWKLVTRVRWSWVILFLMAADAALAHGPGRKLKAEATPCGDKPTQPTTSSRPFCLQVQNRENTPLTLTVELVAGEVMANGNPVCIPAHPAVGGGKATLHAPTGEPVTEYPIPPGHDANLTGIITPTPSNPTCLRVRLLPPPLPPDDHAGHVKPLLLLIPMTIP